MGFIAFGGALALVALTAALVAASLRLRGAPAFLLAAYLLGWTEVVALGEIFSVFHAARASLYAVGEAGLFALGLVAWQHAGRPLPRFGRPRAPALLRHPVLLVLALVVVVALAYEAFLVFATPPDNWDSMTYHLARVAYWYQHGGISWDPTAATARINAFPPNAELGILYTILFLGRDTAAALPQLLAEIALMVGVYGSARRLGYGRPPALFAGLVLATLSEIALQSVTTQNDLVVASFVVAGAFFLLGRHRAEVGLAGLALGLAIGTKLTGIFALPIVALLAVAVLPRRRLAYLAAATATAVALVGGFGYVLNLVHTGHLLGPPASTSEWSPVITASGTTSTVARVTYRFADLSGYPLRTTTLKPAYDAGQAVFRALRLDPNPPESTQTQFTFWTNRHAHEDISYFGPLGLLLLPLGFAFAWAGIFRRGDRTKALLGLAIPLFVVELAFAYRYNLWIGRFVTLPVALAMPLSAWAYRRRAIAAAVTVLAAMTLFYAHLDNIAKPPGGGAPPVWKLDRAAAESLTRPEMQAPLEAISRLVGEHARLGVVFRPEHEDWVYPLYGSRLTRHLVPLPATGELVAAADLRVDAIVLGSGVRRPAVASACWRTRSFPASGWKLLLRRPACGHPSAGRA